MKPMDELIIEELQHVLDQYFEAKERYGSANEELEYFMYAKDFAESVTGRHIVKKGFEVHYATTDTPDDDEADVINFVACLTYGSELLPITLDDAQFDIEEWKREGVEIPRGLTPEKYQKLWNSFCESDD